MKKKLFKLKILGTKYTIWQGTETDFPLLEKYDAYCDRSNKTIVINVINKQNCEIAVPKWYYKKTLRHEIEHAFLYESGLDSNINNEIEHKHDEQMIDWHAVMHKKIHKAYKKAKVL